MPCFPCDHTAEMPFVLAELQEDPWPIPLRSHRPENTALLTFSPWRTGLGKQWNLPACGLNTKQRKGAPPQREKIIFCSKLMFIIFVQVSCPGLYVKIEVEETRKAWDTKLKKKRKIFQKDGWEYEIYVSNGWEWEQEVKRAKSQEIWLFMWFGAEVRGPPCEHRGQAPAPCSRRPPGSCAAAVACPANMLQVLLVLVTRVQHRGAQKPGPELCQCQWTCSLSDSRWDHHILRNDILLHRTADCRCASMKPTYKWTRLKFSQLESHRHTFSKLLDTVRVLNLCKVWRPFGIWHL